MVGYPPTGCDWQLSSITPATLDAQLPLRVRATSRAATSAVIAAAAHPQRILMRPT